MCAMSLRNARSKQACFQGENRRPGIAGWPPTSPWPLFCRPTPHDARTSGIRPGTDLPPLATAIHRPPNCQKPNGTRSRRAARLSSTSRQRAKSTAGTERIGHGGATHQTANLCSKLNCASLPRPQGRAGARLFQQPDLENHWVPMRNRALPSAMAFVAQATHPAGALLRDRQAAA